MPRIHAVRHGAASAGFGADADPGLSDEGRAQAELVADTFAALDPRPILVSPLRRCRETAAPLEARWGIAAVVDPAIAEVAAPSTDLEERSIWLRGALASNWSVLEDGPRAWRDQLLARVARIDVDAVLVTHFVVVNALIGAATGDDRVMIERLANGSCTVFDVENGSLRLVASGVEGASEVL